LRAIAVAENPDEGAARRNCCAGARRQDAIQGKPDSEQELLLRAAAIGCDLKIPDELVAEPEQCRWVASLCLAVAACRVVAWQAEHCGGNAASGSAASMVRRSAMIFLFIFTQAIWSRHRTGQMCR